MTTPQLLCQGVSNKLWNLRNPEMRCRKDQLHKKSLRLLQSRLFFWGGVLFVCGVRSLYVYMHVSHEYVCVREERHGPSKAIIEGQRYWCCMQQLWQHYPHNEEVQINWRHMSRQQPPVKQVFYARSWSTWLPTKAVVESPNTDTWHSLNAFIQRWLIIERCIHTVIYLMCLKCVLMCPVYYFILLLLCSQ